MMSVETMRQGGHVSRIRGGQGTIDEPIPLDDRAHYRSGILIFSRREKLLHANRRGLEMTGHLDQAEIETVDQIRLVPVRELWHAIRAALDHRRTANIWEPFELKRILFEVRRKILLRGLGLTDQDSHDASRIVMVLEELGPRQECYELENQMMTPYQERNGTVILGSAQPGSDRGVFDVGMYGTP